MQITYCDLCAAPLKDNNAFMLYITEPKDSNFNEISNYVEYMKKVQQGVKEICPSCKHIFDKIFDLKLQRLSELTEEINLTYNLKAKLNPKDRKDGKEKK